MKNEYNIGDIIEGPFGPMKVIKDFLPPPEVLAKAPVHIIKKSARKDSPKQIIPPKLMLKVHKRAKQAKIPVSKLITTYIEQGLASSK